MEEREGGSMFNRAPFAKITRKIQLKNNRLVYGENFKRALRALVGVVLSLDPEEKISVLGDFLRDR